MCEDLARIDEVAELIRDVGPTLVVTILLDGPQLATRWTARYAGVLADDPGTAVLTLTAHGMVERSRPTGMPPSTVVALWKDPTRGLREISLEHGATGVLMSVAATRSRRRVADGRTPVDNSAGLMVAGVFPVAPAQEVVPHARRRPDVGRRGAGRRRISRSSPAGRTRSPKRWNTPRSRRTSDRRRAARRPVAPGARAAGALGALARALTALADVVTAVTGGADGERDAAILAALRTTSTTGTPRWPWPGGPAVGAGGSAGRPSVLTRHG